MTGHTLIDPSTLTTYLLPDGDVALESSSLSPSENLKVFGDNGVCPPTPFERMVDGCLKMIAAVPDSPDAAALEAMAIGLKSSLAKVETTLARLTD